MAAPLLTLTDIHVGFGGGPPVLAGVSMTLERGDRACLVGRNGSGKSTLMRILARAQPSDGGDYVLVPGARVAYLPQEPDLGDAPDVHSYVATALPPHHVGEDYRVSAALDALGLTGAEKPAHLSGGQARRADLARALVSDPDLLLLDEPTNHLDLPAIEWLEAELQAFRGAFVVVSHDRRFLEHLTKRTLWLDRGKMRTQPFGFERFETWAEETLVAEAAERRRMDKLIEQEIQWSREGISARRTRNQGRLRRLHSLRDERAEWRKNPGQAKAELRAGEASGKRVVEVRDLTYQWPGAPAPSVKGFSSTILRGDRIGVVGPNGSGKTTLLRLLIGELEPDTGTVKLGTRLTPVYFDQRRESLDEEITLWDTLADGPGDQVMVHGEPKHVVGYLKEWLFDGRDARRPVRSLSGGERARLLLARAFAKPCNLIILDEPTNDLDLETLDLLQEVLADFDGTAILVSHDRDFLDRVVTSTIVLEGEGHVTEYAGGYTDMRQQQAAEVKAAAPAPKAREKGERAKGERAKARLSFKEKRDLETLPETIAALERELTQLDALLADGTFYINDHKSFHETFARSKEARGELAAAEERWLELEMLRESIEG